MPVLASPGDDERSRDAARKRQVRSSSRDIEIPAPFDPIRRRDCLEDPYEFLSTYLAEKFPLKWTADRRAMVDEIVYRIEYGGKKAKAAPRGKGKTSIGEGTVGIWGILAGKLRFPVIIGATGSAADQILANIKAEYERNPMLALDFPEVCVPILALEGWSSRARMQTVNGQRTHLVWCNDHVVFPTIEGSPSSGAILATRSIDGAIRGLRVINQRPDFVLIDDPETRDSARSETECEKRERTIEKDVGGLGGAGKQVSVLILTTCQSCSSLSYRFTDPKQKPAYAGERLKTVLEWPTRADLWDKYAQTRCDNKEAGDVEAREAHEFYLANRAEMDAGAVLSDDDSFDTTELPDGSPREVSALQHVNNVIADIGLEAFLTEYQNDPPADDLPQGSGITVGIVRGSATGYDGRMTGNRRRELPSHEILTAFVDCNDRFLTYEVCAWLPEGRCVVVDYGKQQTDSVSVVGIPTAIRRGLDDVWEDFRKAGYNIHCGLIDSGDGDHTAAVYEWIGENGGPWHPSKGDGKWKAPIVKGDKFSRRTPYHWHLTTLANCPRQLVVMDSNYWKAQSHQAFLVKPLSGTEHARGAVRIFGADPHGHTEFASEICAEEFVRTWEPGKGFKEEWRRKSKANHWLDTHYGNHCAASVGRVLLSMRNAPQRRFGVLSKGV